MFVPDYENCKSTVTGLGFCGVEICRNEWAHVHSLAIQHKSAQLYNINKEIKIFLRTNKIIGTELWTNVTLPEIKVSTCTCMTFEFLTFVKDWIKQFC
jgi:hypothetical protein